MNTCSISLVWSQIWNALVGKLGVKRIRRNERDDNGSTYKSEWQPAQLTNDYSWLTCIRHRAARLEQFRKRFPLVYSDNQYSRRMSLYQTIHQDKEMSGLGSNPWRRTTSIVDFDWVRIHSCLDQQHCLPSNLWGSVRPMTSRYRGRRLHPLDACCSSSSVLQPLHRQYDKPYANTRTRSTFTSFIFTTVTNDHTYNRADS